ncbi:hypothetical protein C0J52_21538, partial [Blattella germanica]
GLWLSGFLCPKTKTLDIFPNTVQLEPFLLIKCQMIRQRVWLSSEMISSTDRRALILCIYV